LFSIHFIHFIIPYQQIIAIKLKRKKINNLVFQIYEQQNHSYQTKMRITYPIISTFPKFPLRVLDCVWKPQLHWKTTPASG
jgi:hypothetical protein